MNTVAALVVALVVIVGAVVAQSFEWTDRADKHPRLKKITEAKTLRVVLLFVSIGLLGVVVHDVNEIRERLESPPPHPRPAAINFNDIALCTVAEPVKPCPVARSNDGILGSTVSGNSGSVTGSIKQTGRNNIAQTGPNSNATINEIPPARRISAKVAAELQPKLRSMAATVNITAIMGDNEAQQLGVDLYNLLRQSGWTMKNPIVMSTIINGAPYPPGVTVYLHGEPPAKDTEVQIPFTDPFWSLKELFDKARIKFRLSTRMGTPGGQIDIDVGPEPRE